MKRNYIHYLCALFIALCSSLSMAQTYESAYILITPNDTLKGYILDQTDAELAKSISFSKNKKGSPNQIYLPSDLYGFAFVNGRKFTTDELLIVGDTTLAFSKEILTGKLNLSIVRNNGRIKNYIIIHNNLSGEHVVISNSDKEIKVREDGSKYTKKSFEHIGLINLIKIDSSYQAVDNTFHNYSENKVIKDIEKYNELFSKDYPTDKYKPKKKFTFDVLAGIPMIYSDQKHYAFSLNTNYTKVEQTRTVSLRMGISYYLSQYDQNTTSVYGNNTTYNEQESVISITPFGLHLQGRERVLRPYIYFGIGMAMLTDKYISFATSSPELILNSWTENSYNLSMDFAAGLKIKTGKNYTVMELKPGPNAFFALVGYSF